MEYGYVKNLIQDNVYKFKTNKGDQYLATYIGNFSGGLVFRFSDGTISIYDYEFINIIDEYENKLKYKQDLILKREFIRGKIAGIKTYNSNYTPDDLYAQLDMLDELIEGKNDGE